MVSVVHHPVFQPKNFIKTVILELCIGTPITKYIPACDKHCHLFVLRKNNERLLSYKIHIVASK